MFESDSLNFCTKLLTKANIDCLGNYLLLSKSHNCTIGNKPFQEKRATFLHTAQQRQIQELSTTSGVWSKELIQSRKDDIVSSVIESL